MSLDTGSLDLPQEAWDRALIEHGGHLLQSWNWGEFKSLHGWQPERVAVSGPHGQGYAQILFRTKGPVSLGYIPRGPIMVGEADKVWPELRAGIDAACRRHRAISCIIEADRNLGLSGSFQDNGLVAGPAHLQPARTVKMSLDDDDVMLKRMHQKTRYNVRLATRKGVEVESRPADEESLRQFYQLMLDTSQRNEFSIHSYDYYADFVKVMGDDAYLVFARWDGHLAAVVIAAAFAKEAVYMYGASSTEHRAHGAAFLLQFEAMRWARDRGCTTYDLWGIPVEDPGSLRGEDNQSLAATKGDDWRGIYRFKTGFGGDVVSYPPMVERRYVPVLPWLARRLGVVHG